MEGDVSDEGSRVASEACRIESQSDDILRAAVQDNLRVSIPVDFGAGMAAEGGNATIAKINFFGERLMICVRKLGQIKVENRMYLTWPGRCCREQWIVRN